MTLQEWSIKYNVSIKTLPSGAKVIPHQNMPQIYFLWLLTDYSVSSVFAGSIFLVPAKTFTAEEYINLVTNGE